MCPKGFLKQESLQKSELHLCCKDFVTKKKKKWKKKKKVLASLKEFSLIQLFQVSPCSSGKLESSPALKFLQADCSAALTTCSQKLNTSIFGVCSWQLNSIFYCVYTDPHFLLLVTMPFQNSDFSPILAETYGLLQQTKMPTLMSQGQIFFCYLSKEGLFFSQNHTGKTH